MKTNFLILFLLLGCTILSAQTQTERGYHSERFRDNIFFGIGLGGQLNLNPDNFDYGIGHAITPAVNLSLGKHFTPVWGGRFQTLGIWSTLYSNYGLAAGRYDKIEKHYVDLQADLLFNITNAIKGYQPGRLFTLSAFGGPGLTAAKVFGKADKTNFLINGSLGLLGAFHVTNCIDINIEARMEVSPSIFGKAGNAYTDGVVFVCTGASYTFGGRKYKSYSQVDQDALNTEINKLRQEIDRLRNQPVKEVIKEVVKDCPKYPEAKVNFVSNVVFFRLGSANIDKNQEVSIFNTAKYLQDNPNVKVKVIGYADKKTGTPSINEKLSEKRAKNVANALINKYNISSNRITVEWKGDIVQPYAENEWNRVAIFYAE
ncbi:MAG: OmpA family protein [Prevotella sp.]|jgi:outer membrane protein OmpA-like peptidoglycan-associated protein|nr:OmpA family protein [Prevotella sp.]